MPHRGPSDLCMHAATVCDTAPGGVSLASANLVIGTTTSWAETACKTLVAPSGSFICAFAGSTTGLPVSGLPLTGLKKIGEAGAGSIGTGTGGATAGTATCSTGKKPAFNQTFLTKPYTLSIAAFQTSLSTDD